MCVFVCVFHVCVYKSICTSVRVCIHMCVIVYLHVGVAIALVLTFGKIHNHPGINAS